MQKIENPIGLDGIEFVEFTSDKPMALDELFLAFGFSRVSRHQSRAVDYYRQNDIHFLLATESGSFARKFGKLHGPSICSMGWRVKNAKNALATAVARGAKACTEGDWTGIPAIYGIGDSLVYFIDNYADAERYAKLGFRAHPQPMMQKDLGFTFIDHLTNNVELGTMKQWSDFYKNIFGFYEVRYFDIRGVQTGLQSYALKSPCGKFCIPINEAKEHDSQINEYLRDYHGPGIQHLAFATDDILKSLEGLRKTKIETLDIDDDYYATIYDRVPNVTEDRKKIKEYQVLVDGDEKGYLLQIFTRNVIGPIFIEIIQRKNHYSFGEGNFGALFKSIERDQMRRGVLKAKG